MTELEGYKLTMQYRQKLIEYGKQLSFQNPDRLSMEELQATTLAIFNQLNEIDMANGYEYHEVGIKTSISKDRMNELFLNFIDWYRVIDTPSNRMYDFTKKHFPVQSFNKILCVGDGEYCHLGRKLADLGYDVVSIDPEAKKEFSGKIGKGKLFVIPGFFHKDAIDMVNVLSWADAVVGSKIPLCVEDLSSLSKPSAFSIGTNPEQYGMKFKGKPITSYNQFVEEIKKCPGVEVEKMPKDGISTFEEYIFYHNGIQRERNRE